MQEGRAQPHSRKARMHACADPDCAQCSDALCRSCTRRWPKEAGRQDGNDAEQPPGLAYRPRGAVTVLHQTASGSPLVAARRVVRFHRTPCPSIRPARVRRVHSIAAEPDPQVAAQARRRPQSPACSMKMRMRAHQRLILIFTLGISGAHPETPRATSMHGKMYCSHIAPNTLSR